MDCLSCGGALLALPTERLSLPSADASFTLSACMTCGEVTRSEVTYTVVN